MSEETKSGRGEPEMAREPVRKFGDYELLAEIAHGGMGVVYHARQVSLNRTVAVKMIAAGRLASTADVQRFRTEAEAAAGLDHPNIVPIHEVGEYEGRHFFSMRYVEGGTLARRMSEFALPQSDAPRAQISERKSRIVQLMVQVSRAVHYAHQRGIFHRDLKPGNILMDLKGEPHVADFGLARLTEQESDLTGTQAILGTPNYMSPEQASGRVRELTTASDIFSLGAILYELMTGRPPFPGDTALETLRKVKEEEPTRPRAVNREVDKDLETICLKCLEKEPAARYGSAEALAEDLERWQRSEPIRARPSTPLERSIKWVRRKPARAALGTVSAVAVVVLAAFMVQSRDNVRLELAYRKANEAQRAEAAAKKKQEEQRIVAETALAELQQARVAERIALIEAESQKQNAEASVQKLRRVTYMRNLALAERELSAGDPVAADKWLHECETELRGWEWRYLKHRSDEHGNGESQSIRVITNASKGMYSVAFSSDESKLYSLGNSGVVINDLRTEKLFLTNGFGRKPVYGRVARSPMSDWFGYVRIDASTQKVTIINERSLGAPEVLGHDHVYDLAFSPTEELVATCAQPPDADVRLYRLGSNEPPRRLGYSTNGFMAVVISPQGSLIAAADSTWHPDQSARRRGKRVGPSVIRLWDRKTGQVVRTLEGHKHCIWRLAFSPDGNRLASCSGRQNGGGSGEIKIWDVKTGRAVFDLEEAHRCIFAVAISPDGNRLASGGGILKRQAPEDIKIWDLTTGTELFSLKGHLGTIFDLAFSPSGKYLMSASSDATVRVWSANLDATKHQLDLHQHYNAALDEEWYQQGIDLVKLPRGRIRLAGILFDVNGLIQLGTGAYNNRSYPGRVSHIKTGTACGRLHFLHSALANAKNGRPRLWSEVAKYEIHYTNNITVEIPIVLGRDVGRGVRHRDALNLEDYEQLVFAWTGPSACNPDQLIQLFKTTWENPHPELEIESIDFISTDDRAAPFLVAITAEWTQ